MKFSNLNRIYIILPLNENNSLIFREDLAHYLKNVLRVKINEKLRIFNEDDGEYIAQITNISKGEILALIIQKIREPIQKRLEQSLVLGLSLIKNDRFIEAIKMAVQLSVTKIVPVISERSSIHNLNYSRLKRCIIEAAEQCERLSIPKLSEMKQLKDFASLEDFNNIIYANEDEKSNISMKDLIKLSGNVGLLIGPEGGFSALELDLMSRWKNSYSISLGDYVLRSETAVAAALAQVSLMRT